MTHFINKPRDENLTTFENYFAAEKSKKLCSHFKPLRTVAPPKPNLPPLFIRTTQTRLKQKQTKVTNFIQKF